MQQRPVWPGFKDCALQFGFLEILGHMKLKLILKFSEFAWMDWMDGWKY